MSVVSLDTPVPVRPRGVLVALVVWFLLQLPRLIALPLVLDVSAGREDPAWMFPAVLDIVVAVAAVPVAWTVWRRRSPTAWFGAVLLLVVSLIDHADAATAALLTTTPQVFGGPDGPASAAVVPVIQAGVDVVALVLLHRQPVRAWFGLLRPEAPTIAR